MWDPKAIIVLILAVAVSGAHLVAVGFAAWHGKQVGEVGGDVLIAILGAIVAIIAAYVGSPRNGSNHLPQKKGPPDDGQPS